MEVRKGIMTLETDAPEDYRILAAVLLIFPCSKRNDRLQASYVLWTPAPPPSVLHELQVAVPAVAVVVFTIPKR